MRETRRRAVLISLLLAVTLSGCGIRIGGDRGVPAAEGYPNRPVTLTAAAQPGSGFDVTARAMAETLQKEDVVDVPTPVQNRPGAAGVVWLTQMVGSFAGADDQLSVASLSVMSNQVRGRTPLGIKDITMLATIMEEPFIIVAPSSGSIQDLRGLVDTMKTDIGGVQVAVGAGDDQIPVGLVAKIGGVDPSAIRFVTYGGGGGEQTTALLNGDADVAIGGVSEFQSQIEAGTLRGLGLVSDERLGGTMSEVPTSVEQGYNVTITNWRGIYGPPDMPDYAVKYWQDAIGEALETETWRSIAASNNWESHYLTGDQMNQYLDSMQFQVVDALRAMNQAVV
jgi:putative tricarboxylic transport membrane protein